MAITTTVIASPSTAPSGPDWATILLAAKQGAADGINEWLNTARMEGGFVNVTVGRFTAPLIKSDLRWISPRVNDLLVPAVSAQIPGIKGGPIAQAISLEIAHAWSEWVADFHYPVTKSAAFPSFAANPGPHAPPRPPLPPIHKLSVVDGVSKGSARLTRATFSSRLRAALDAAGAMSLAPVQSAGAPAGSALAMPFSTTQQMKAGATPMSVTQQMQLGKPRTSVSQQIKLPTSLNTTTQQLNIASSLTSGAGQLSVTQQMKLATTPPVGSFAAVAVAKSPPTGSTAPRRYNAVVAITNAAVSGPQDFADQLGAWISDSFSRWAVSAYFDNIMGQGPVPAFAPPYVPVGAVYGGWLTGDLNAQAFGI